MIHFQKQHALLSINIRKLRFQSCTYLHLELEYVYIILYLFLAHPTFIFLHGALYGPVSTFTPPTLSLLETSRWSSLFRA